VRGNEAGSVDLRYGTALCLAPLHHTANIKMGSSFRWNDGEVEPPAGVPGP